MIGFQPNCSKWSLAMRIVIWVFVSVSSAIYADAQVISERRCDACARAGLEIFMWDIQHESVMTDSTGRVIESRFEGRIYIHFRNTGTMDWRIERVNCHFFDSGNNRLFSRSIDMERFLVAHNTWNERSDPFGLAKWEPRMKADCWIENAIVVQ